MRVRHPANTPALNCMKTTVRHVYGGNVSVYILLYPGRTWNNLLSKERATAS